MTRSPASAHVLLPLVELLALTFVTPVSAQTATWADAHEITGRSGAVMAYDSHRRKVVRFGGREIGRSSTLPDSTWEWDGVHWIERAPATRPQGIIDGTMAFDAGRRCMVLVGRQATSRAMETWEWDGDDWIARTTAVAPPARGLPALAYDLVRKRIVMFGGQVSGTLYSDTWEWDGSKWALMKPASDPGPRRAPMAYDLVRQRMVLYGGQGPRGIFADTWEYDGTNWVSRAQQGAPGLRRDHQMVYDVARNRTILFDGDWLRTNPTGETFEWDGSRWTKRNPRNAPSWRLHYAMAYDVTRRRTVVFGGYDYRVGLVDTWEYDGNDWSDRSKPRPGARFFPQMTYDPARQRCLLFGGGNFRVGLPFADTWEWDGVGWTKHTPQTSPPHMSAKAMAAAPGGRVILYDTGKAETWSWDGTNWTLLRPTRNPGIRGTAEMVFDSGRQRTVIFGGYRTTDLNDTWEWDGTNWTEIQPVTRPPGRGRQAMSYDEHRKRVVMFGGWDGRGSPFGDTWEWDGVNWTQRNPTRNPGARAFGKMAYDPVRRRTVLFQDSPPDETWEWDGANWARSAAANPVSSGDFALMWHAARRRMTLFDMSTGSVHHYGLAHPTRSVAIGRGCAGANGLPRLVSTEPYIGNGSYSLDLVAAQPNAVSVFAVATATGQTPVGGGCSLYLAGPMILFGSRTDAPGFATLRLPIPLDPSLRGLTLYGQAFVADPRGSALGLAFTAGRMIVVGD